MLCRRTVAQALALGLLMALATDAGMAAEGRPPASATESERAMLEAMVGKPAVGPGRERLGEVADIILDDSGREPRLLVIAVAGTSRQVLVAFRGVGFHMGRQEVHLSGMTLTELNRMPEFSPRADSDMVSLRRGPAPQKGRPVPR